jgi:hypothetical protein
VTESGEWFARCRDSDEGGLCRELVRLGSRRRKTWELMRVREEPVSIKKVTGKAPIRPLTVRGR